MPRHLKIAASWQGLTIFDAVRRAFPEVGPREAFRKARLREILRNEAPCHPLERLSAGDIVTVVLFRPPRPAALVPLRRDEEVGTAAGPFRIVWEDEDLLAVSKPSGCASHPALRHSGDTLIERVRAHLEVRPGDAFQPALANRLDLETSGIVLVAKTRSAQRILGRRFQNGSVEKLYLALVGGWPPPTGEILLPLVKHPDSRALRRSNPEAPAGKIQEAVTKFRVLELLEHPLRCALVEVALLTGRTHQIRRHLTHIGHPLAGDRRYGDPGFSEDVARFGDLSRMFLHAWRVNLDHPSGRGRLELRAPLPEELADCVRALGGRQSIGGE